MGKRLSALSECVASGPAPVRLHCKKRECHCSALDTSVRGAHGVAEVAMSAAPEHVKQDATGTGKPSS
jgi:hypothetical protein